jgi:hypothetical protein
MSLLVISSTTMQVLHAVLGLCILVPLTVPATRLGFYLPAWMTQSGIG